MSMRETGSLPRVGGGLSGSTPLPSVQALLDARTLLMLATVAAIGLGLIVRAAHVLSTDFPLNDGGLFYAMTRDLSLAGYQIPPQTSYNEAQIPFSYSPLAFYIAALLHNSLGIELIALLRWLPLLATGLTVVAFWLLARAMLPSPWTVVAAVVAFSLLPRSFIWLIMGGGLTRSIGFLCAILALFLLWRFYHGASWKYAAGAGLCGALTLASHLGTAPFLAWSGLLFWLVSGRSKRGFVGALAAAVGAALITSPWWLTVVTTHGLGPFIAAQNTGSTIFSARTWEQLPSALAWGGFGTAESLLPLIGMAALLGCLITIAQRRWFLPIWWASILLIDTRAGVTYAALPVAMLAGIGIVEGVLPLLRERQPAERLRVAVGLRPTAPPLHLVIAMLALLLCVATASSVVSRRAWVGELRQLYALGTGERAAMQWVLRSTTPDNRFLVITGSGWEVDRTSEWFPVLAERVSVATVQGTEWLPPGTFDQFRERYNRVQACAGKDMGCIDSWQQSTNTAFSHVYVAKPTGAPCCSALRDSLRGDSRYEVVYDGPGATIFARRS
jgi:hypothetical protein